MPHSFGYRARTRDMFSREFRKNGVIPLSTYMTTYKIGDYVDIKANAAIHKGMPHKGFHGRTGRIYNVTKRAVGVRVNKQVGNRIIHKQVIVRVEHVRPSKCREEVKRRIKENEAAKVAAKNGERKCLKRQARQPKAGYILKTKGVKPTLMRAQPFVDLV